MVSKYSTPVALSAHAWDIRGGAVRIPLRGLELTLRWRQSKSHQSAYA